LWLQISLSAQNRIIQNNLENTVKYVKYDTTYNTPTLYDPSRLISKHARSFKNKRNVTKFEICGGFPPPPQLTVPLVWLALALTTNPRDVEHTCNGNTHPKGLKSHKHVPRKSQSS